MKQKTYELFLDVIKNTPIEQKPKEPVKRILNKTPSTGKPKELDWEKDIKFEIRKALYIDPQSLKNWKFSVDKWGENCPMCGKLFVPNDYANEFEKKLMEKIKQTLTQQRTELLEEIKKEIDYSEAHHEVILGSWEEESRDVFKSKSEVNGFLMALESFRELITNLLNKKNETK